MRAGPALYRLDWNRLMHTFGNVVTLPQRASTAPARPQVHRHVPAAPFSPLERKFATIAMEDITITFGVMKGEEVQTGDDFVVGDTFIVSQTCTALAANDHAPARDTDRAFVSECATLKALAEFAQVHRLTLMDQFGNALTAYTVTPNHKGMRAPYVLLPRDMCPSRPLTLIKSVAL